MALPNKKRIKFGLYLGVAAAVAIHGLAILFGGKMLPGHGPDAGTLAKVDLFSETEMKAKEDKAKEENEQQPPEETEKMETEKVPDSTELIRSMEAAQSVTPKLEAASLGSIEAALSGAGSAGSGDFSQGMDFASGGRIGGTGKVGQTEKTLDDAFSLTEIDQKPRAVFQASPIYPSSMRTTEGLVTILCVVDASGKVTMPRIEKASQPDFEKPAIDAVKQWKFEPAVKDGKRVACKMRIPIRFKPRQKS